MNLAGIAVRGAERFGERVALRLGDLAVTFAELEERSARTAGFLRGIGVERGDRVAVMLPNVPEFAYAYYGALRLGAIVLPLNPLLKRREVAFLLRDSGARTILALQGMHEHPVAGAAETGAECVRVTVGSFPPADAEPDHGLAATAPGDTAVLIYSSGMTGTPKGAELTHSNLDRNSAVSAAMFDLRSEDLFLGALPLFHAFGATCALNAPLRCGGGTTLLPRFDPAQALELIEGHGVTVCLGVPTMYAAMLERADGFEAPALRYCVSGGSPLPLDVLEAGERVFGCPMLEGYGLTESAPVASFNRPDRPRKPGSIGYALEETELRVVDPDGRVLPPGEVGEIVVRGHGVMKGYWRDPEATARVLRDGWLHTGDLAYADADGWFFIVDRLKDMIIRGGLNVYPREVETVLLEHPAVREAAVVAVPHPVLGEEVGAAVVLEPGASAEEKELRAFVRDEIAAYKYPRHIWFVDALPRDEQGAVRKRAIAVPDAVLERAARRS